MTARERWLTAGLVAAGLALVALLVWSQVQASDARAAVRGWLEFEQRLAQEGKQHPLARQARPELRGMLQQGDYGAVVRRLRTLVQEEETGAASAASATAPVPVDELWPLGSSARAGARRLLRLMVERQQQGYDIAPAQEVLLRVAEAARAGNREEALRLFAEAGALVENARLRPGFTLPGAPSARAATGSTPGASDARSTPPSGASPPTPETVQMVAALERMRTGLRMAGAAPQLSASQRSSLRLLEPLVDEAVVAARAGRDLRGAAAALQQAFGTAMQQAGDQGAVVRAIEQARAAIRTAPLLPRGAFPTPAPPGAVPQPSPAGADGGDASQPPSAGTPGEAFLHMLDEIRKMPEGEYRARRAELAAAIPRGLATPQPPGRSFTPIVIGAEGGVAVALDPTGSVIELYVAGRPLSRAFRPSPVAAIPGEGPPQGLTGTLRRAPGAEGPAVYRARLPGGAVEITWVPVAGGFEGRVRARRGGDGPAALEITLPVRVGGWRWSSAGRTEVIALDAPPEPVAGSSGQVTLSGGGTTLQLLAESASEIRVPGGAAHLVFRLPLVDGVTEHTLRVTGAVELPGSR